MSKFTRQLLIMGLLVIVSVFFGMELASKGINRIQGPMSSGAPTVSQTPTQRQMNSQVEVPSPAPATASSTAPARGLQEDAPAFGQSSAVTKDSLINRVGNKTGELLQIVAYHGIKKVVSLFNVWIN